ncbi:MAG: DUF1800 domain-containing protein [Sulfitobacter sp.]
MKFDPFLAEHRFGYGRSPSIAPPEDVGDMLAELQRADHAQAAFPIPPFRVLQDALALRIRFNSYARKNPDTAEGKAAGKKARQIVRDMGRDHSQWFVQTQLRRITTRHGFRERLAAFWADHFTAKGGRGLLRFASPLYVEEAVRPYVTGGFAGLLTACITHPLMLHYLDQNTSAGPNSRVAKRRNRQRGLNENLAREVLELHTLGVDGPYDQSDVRELAKLLTGLSATRHHGFKFRPAMVEPGAKMVLGRTYSAEGGVETIRQALNDLASHPATAAHIARKLAVHFVSDAPSNALVAHISAAYLRSDGNLPECYIALLEHPHAWPSQSTNMRPPDEFISAALRSLEPSAQSLHQMDLRMVREVFLGPLQQMGQAWLAPSGPDGFAENDSAWATPQGISARLDWAVNAPARLVPQLPDPRLFVQAALGEHVPDAVSFAANAAETREVAIGLILAAPAFQRR